MLQAKTQDIIPESGLGPQNSQWRRWVERSITDLKRSLKAFRADIANSFKAVSSSMELLSRQVGGLGDAVDDINDLIGSTISVDYDRTRTADMVIPVESTKVAWSTFYTPAGYSQVLVTVTAVGMAKNSTPYVGHIYLKVFIDGVAHGEVLARAEPGAIANLTGAGASKLTGLTGGQSFEVAAFMRASTGAWASSSFNGVNLYTQVLFLR